jgi:hypothetical protein
MANPGLDEAKTDDRRSSSRNLRSKPAEAYCLNQL